MAAVPLKVKKFSDNGETLNEFFYDLNFVIVYIYCSWFATIYYVVAYKTINMYYLKKSHDLLNRSRD